MATTGEAYVGMPMAMGQYANLGDSPRAAARKSMTLGASVPEFGLPPSGIYPSSGVYDPQSIVEPDIPVNPFPPNNLTKPGVIRSHYKVPYPKYGPRQSTLRHCITNGVARDAAWAPMEPNVAPGVTAPLAPSQETKQWYNTWLYVPEKPKGGVIQNQFMDRYVMGPGGTWIDTWRAQDRSRFLESKVQEETKRWEYDESIRNCEAVDWEPHLYDAYSGANLVSVHGQMVPADDIRRTYKVKRSEWSDAYDMVFKENPYDMFRFMTPAFMDKRHPNKRIDQYAYDYFDRRNPNIKRDEDYEFIETAGSFVDAERHSAWRTRDGNTPADVMADLVNHYSTIDN